MGLDKIYFGSPQLDGAGQNPTLFSPELDGVKVLKRWQSSFETCVQSYLLKSVFFFSSDRFAR